MKIGFYQFVPLFGRPAENRDRLAQDLAAVDADIMVLPELAFSGYNFSSPREARSLAEPIPGPSTDMLMQTAQKTGTVYIAGIAELNASDVYNSAVMVGPQGVIGTYRKIHLFNEEKLNFKSGEDGFFLHRVENTVIGVLVCFDHIFPEAARTLALKGADIICHPSNLVLPEYAQLTTRVRSIENRVFWVLCNRWGTETNQKSTLTFTGESRIYAPGGAVLARAEACEDKLAIVEVDPQKAGNKQLNQYNDLFADRKPQFYAL